MLCNPCLGRALHESTFSVQGNNAVACALSCTLGLHMCPEGEPRDKTRVSRNPEMLFIS